MTTTSPSAQPELPIACDMMAIAADQREGHIALATRLLEAEFQERYELPDGYAWRFPADTYEEVCKFVDNARRCCPFLAFTIETTAGRGPIWLRITGSVEGKAALMAGIDDLPKVGLDAPAG
jgi:hypothetical protein